MNSSLPSRVASIDIFRALTMWLMIFVNDLWSLTDIPEWLGHAQWDEDRLGFSDIIFPAFLFIVGLSIPFAIRAREKKGDTKGQIVRHILERTLALVVMGFFMVNLENTSSELLPIPKAYWQILMTLAFFLIWNTYANRKAFGKIPDRVMAMIGVAILIVLAAIFTGGSLEEPVWMRPYWWGILGLIGWAYGLCALVYLYVRENLIWVGLVTLVFYLLNVQEFVSPFSDSFRVVVSASNHASVMSGILTTVLFLKLRGTGKSGQLVLEWLGIALLLFVFGFMTRSVWGISKIQATPSWTSICAGISILSFVILYWIADKRKMTSWAKFIEPAGKSTLTCYLIPYFVYAIFLLTDFKLPEFLTTGVIGLLKSLVFGLLIIYITGLISRVNIRLKI